MAHFYKPSGNTSSGYDVDNKLAPGSVWRLRIPKGETRNIALFGGSGLKLDSNNPGILGEITEIEMVRPEQRTFRLTALTEGTTLIDTRDSSGAQWVILQVQVLPSAESQAYLGPTLQGKDANFPVRLINFASRSSALVPAHKEAIAKLVQNLRNHAVADIFINGYAHADTKMAEARANAVAAELTSLAPWLSPMISITATDDTSWRTSKSGSDAYWRGVDVLPYFVYRNTAAANPGLAPDVIPPMPGPRRYSDWEVYGAMGVTFQVAPMAVIAIDAFHFRRKSQPSYGAWFATVRFGAGQSFDLLQSVKALKLIKQIGLPRFMRLTEFVGKGVAAPLWERVSGSIMSAVGGVSVSQPSYSDAPAVTPFALSDLNGATAFGGSASAKAFAKFGYGAASLTVQKPMPQYQYKFIDTRTPPQWKMVSHATVSLIADVDVGGAAMDVGPGVDKLTPSVSFQFVGGPLIQL